MNKQIEQFKKGVKAGTNIIERLEEENKKLKEERDELKKEFQQYKEHYNIEKDKQRIFSYDLIKILIRLLYYYFIPMENKLEQLLNSLIEKGWLPRGDKNWKNNTRITNIYFRQDENGKLPHIRMIVSKESGLWQFVCENRLWKDIDEEKYWHKKTPKMSELRSYDYHFEEYRLIESALKDESELEQFLLDNIKV